MKRILTIVLLLSIMGCSSEKEPEFIEIRDATEGISAIVDDSEEDKRLHPVIVTIDTAIFQDKYGNILKDTITTEVYYNGAIIGSVDTNISNFYNDHQVIDEYIIYKIPVIQSINEIPITNVSIHIEQKIFSIMPMM